MSTVTIGSKNPVTIKKTAALAPMASVADSAYRTLCRSFGASYVVSEMVSSKGLFYSDRKTAELCTVTDAERPMGIQLFGEDPEFMKNAVTLIERFEADIIDINMGCPVPKVAGNGAGSALMKDPQKAEKIVRAVKSVSSCPVTVKIRSGWDNDSINAVEFAKRMEAAGADAIAVHPRTRNQMYSGHSDWDIIRQVKQAVSVPVIGNGDVKSALDCKKMYDETGCDLVMIGRASYGNPWIFKSIEKYFETGEILPPPALKERIEVMLTHVRMIVKNLGEGQGMREARKNVAWYLKGLPNAAKYRNECGSLVAFSQLEDMSRRILQSQAQCEE